MTTAQIHDNLLFLLCMLAVIAVGMLIITLRGRK